MKGAESEHPVGVPFYQWVGCRDHAGIACFPHSGSWQAQGGPVYVCRDWRKCVFHNMGPLKDQVIVNQFHLQIKVTTDVMERLKPNSPLKGMVLHIVATDNCSYLIFPD